MHNTMKRILTAVIAVIMIVGMMGVLAVSADSSYTANLGFADTAWGAQEWGENANVTVTGDGSYTISWNVPEGGTAAIDAGVFVIDIVGAQAALDAENKTYNVTALTVSADGVDIPVDLSKIATGDIEKNGNYRIEIYNQYGTTATTLPIDPAAVVFATNLTVNFTIETVDKAAYTANLGFADTAWGAQEWGENANVIITDDGAYTVSWNVPEGGTAAIDAGVFVIDIVGAQAALDAENKTYKVSALTVSADGVDIPVDLSKIATGDIEKNGNFRIEIYNQYGTTATTLPLDPAAVVFATNLTVNFTVETIEKPADSTEEYDLFIAYGGDKAAENDWGLAYEGNDVDGITAVNAKVKSGDTATISLTFAEPNVNSWYFAPCLVPAADGKKLSNIDFTVTCKIDGVEVPIDMAADADGKTWWYEGTGSYTNAIRLAGGYNEWGAHYIAEPAGFSTIEYTITFNSIQIAAEVEEEVVEIPIDLNGTYNAYLMLQTPNWTFRDAHDSDNGLGSAVWGQHITNNDSGVNYGVVTDAVVAGNGTYTVSVTDFGTVFADDFAAASQEYFNILAVSTDIPRSDKIAITDVKLIIDGQVRHEYAEAVLNPDTTQTCQILVQNIWNADVKELNYYPAPTSSLEIQFTVSGFEYDKASEEPVETQPVETQPQETQPQETKPVDGGEEEPKSPIVGIVIAVVAVAAVACGAVVVLKKKKN